MNWRHIKLIYFREMRDQLRDRRTLFTITILPLLLYPLLGMLMLQVAQFKREHSVRACVVGLENWPTTVPLLEEQPGAGNSVRFSGTTGELESRLIEVERVEWPEGVSIDEMKGRARSAVNSGEADVYLIVAPTFAELLSQRQLKSLPVLAESAVGAAEVQAANESARITDDKSSKQEDSSDQEKSQSTAPDSLAGLTVIANMARDRGQLAVRRLQSELDDWHHRWIESRLTDAGVNPDLVRPIPLVHNDTSESSIRRAMIWSKVLPFIMLVWALTGAFYPAVDLCAGEKERGTLETLLSSPARRKEIVWGKLLTVATFSMLSALLNLLSMQLTAGFIMDQLASQGNPQFAEMVGRLPIHAFGWLVLLLIPMSAFFSALALAVAALARSTKEGQYYLMPLLLFAIPLVTLPMIPSLELNVATSLVPVSGAIFVVRAFIEGRFAEGAMYLPFVVVVTGACCLLSIRWAVRQFESESVMFSENERWSFQSWIKQLWRDRGTTASTSEALLCGAIILVAVFFAQFISTGHDLTWEYLARRTVMSQLGLILCPALLMAVMLTKSLRQALRIHSVPLIQAIAAIVLGIALHPAYTFLGQIISETLKIGPETAELLQSVSQLINAEPLWAILLVLAVVPAVCEELTYRGFIFAGLVRNQGSLRAILVSAIFFGLAHSFLQQSIAATLMGVVLGIIAWRTGSVVCTMLIHVVNNSLSLSLSWVSQRDFEAAPALDWMIRFENGQWHYQPLWCVLSLVVAGAMFVVLWRRTAAIERLTSAEAI